MSPAPARRPRSLRLATVAVLFTFGCASVRAPATVLPDVIPVHEGRAEPQLALWVEGGEAPTPAEQATAAEAAKRALAEAAQGLEAPALPDGGDGVLVVRAQGVTRTSGRRSNQVAGAVGLVVGVVVVVAIAILVLAEGGKGGKGSGGRAPKSSTGGARAAPAPSRAAPAVARAGGGGGGGGRVPIAVPGPRVRPVRPGAPSARPAPSPYAVPPRYPHDGVYLYGDPWVSWGWYVDLTPQPPLPFPDAAPAGQGGFQQPLDSWVVAPPAAAPAAEEDAAYELEQAPEELSELRLGAPEPLPLDDRGFFAGDELLVELVVCDRLTGEPRLRKLARKEIDPTDAAKVREFLQRAVKEKKGWEPVVAQVAPAEASPATAP